MFFRSPQPERSWIVAAGCVLDTAAIVMSTVDRPRTAATQLMERTGYLCLRRLADYFGIQYDHDPRPDDPISITCREFDLVVVELQAAGLPLKVRPRSGLERLRGMACQLRHRAAPAGRPRVRSADPLGLGPGGPAAEAEDLQAFGAGGVTPGTESRNDGSSSK